MGVCQPPLQELVRGRDHQKACSKIVHCLLLDRESRQVYICRRDQMILFFSLTEREDGNRIFIDGLRMSPGNQTYTVPPPEDLAEQLQAFLDAQFQFARDRFTQNLG